MPHTCKVFVHSCNVPRQSSFNLCAARHKLEAALVRPIISGLCCFEPQRRRCIVCKAMSSYGDKQILGSDKDGTIQQTDCSSPSCKCPIPAPTVVQSSKHCCRQNCSSPAYHTKQRLLLWVHSKQAQPTIQTRCRNSYTQYAAGQAPHSSKSTKI